MRIIYNESVNSTPTTEQDSFDKRWDDTFPTESGVMSVQDFNKMLDDMKDFK